MVVTHQFKQDEEWILFDTGETFLALKSNGTKILPLSSKDFDHYFHISGT